MTTAERQRAFRRRQAERIAGLEATAAELQDMASDLEDRLATSEAALATANAEIERLAGLACKHPSAAVSGGRCQACGADVW